MLGYGFGRSYQGGGQNEEEATYAGANHHGIDWGHLTDRSLFLDCSHRIDS